jgi:hypothetical protein
VECPGTSHQVTIEGTDASLYGTSRMFALTAVMLARAFNHHSPAGAGVMVQDPVELVRRAKSIQKGEGCQGEAGQQIFEGPSEVWRPGAFRIGHLRPSPQPSTQRLEPNDPGSLRGW